MIKAFYSRESSQHESNGLKCTGAPITRVPNRRLERPAEKPDRSAVGR